MGCGVRAAASAAGAMGAAVMSLVPPAGALLSGGAVPLTMGSRGEASSAGNVCRVAGVDSECDRVVVAVVPDLVAGGCCG